MKKTLLAAKLAAVLLMPLSSGGQAANCALLDAKLNSTVTKGDSIRVAQFSGPATMLVVDQGIASNPYDILFVPAGIKQNALSPGEILLMTNSRLYPIDQDLSALQLDLFKFVQSKQNNVDQFDIDPNAAPKAPVNRFFLAAPQGGELLPYLVFRGTISLTAVQGQVQGDMNLQGISFQNKNDIANYSGKFQAAVREIVAC